MEHVVAKRPSSNSKKKHIIDTSGSIYEPVCGQDRWSFSPEMNVDLTHLSTGELASLVRGGDVCQNCWKSYQGRGFGNEDVLKSDMQRVAENLGHPPPKSEYEEHGVFSYAAVKDELGADDWGSALSKAGIISG